MMPAAWNHKLILAACWLLAAAAQGAGAMPTGRWYVNSLGMRMARLAPGTFLMGSDDGDFDERPVHAVTISRPMYVAGCEVTNTQYERFDPGHGRLRGKPGLSKRDDEAVVFVDWHQASGFCRWLAAKEQLPYRLPTEAEWEYACRAGTTTAYYTGKSLPAPFQKNPMLSWFPGSWTLGQTDLVSLAVGQTPPNAWGLYDLHGNVEEWCQDWYGPYESAHQVDPVGCAGGDFRVTRGGSHSTTLEYLRSANRLGTLPDDKSWLIGFRVVLGPLADTQPLPLPPPPLNRRGVVQRQPTARPPQSGRDQATPDRPYFKGPRTYVRLPPGANGPMFSEHNHDPAIAACPNGDLLALWYSCRSEAGRELGVLASRLRYGAEQWDEASPFWDAPDRNDHAPALWCDGHTLFHFNGLSAAGTWGNLALVARTSIDSGATWSPARLIRPEHGLRHQPVTTVIRTREGRLLLPCDAATGGRGGTALVASSDGGRTWLDPGEGQPRPVFRRGARGAWIAGIHAGIVELADGRIMAFGRGDSIEGQMPMSLSSDGGLTWTYSPSPFPPIGGGQRLVVLRLAEGPLFFASFAAQVPIRDEAGRPCQGSGLFAALSLDEGQSWPVRRLITDDGPPRTVDGGGNTGPFLLSRRSAEPRGYLAVCQAGDHVIHLISSKQHYAFNLAWLRN
jgi:formylglycine-generating enzyme required for sulfatase activity